ncbi:uncharacterized protein OCT59_004086 [Rhizophagus irregularis]|uniref:Dol-P-Glc:Glc(2)Man(9)GlcNAc(2)-PP-Dol alpha-1,2-glucosyltransferase n=1 Tax=Rhizophagus irregularis (strain DAOM 181602 / DAOM 197198 / MUCL 43194) TaxID=747089 RepID=U9SYH3_RHIID|nr:glycosyltransferase family 59 protein [Rhizophagus irregularis DAOM 181602=DAOM 197198]POG62087.1 glycosyltransferase family 59 protein [Rhizophagus irregularis DAOM 181602=DAOM 197198]UZO12554.1 hypothetical protein OCT59_004086 [Rhizophagus irregularis]|eukprot:XP_025168953.1 glycosyltransferase family 59 protein [Rhizophagus irregularis DAOM 181602=DAOM 197198]
MKLQYLFLIIHTIILIIVAYLVNDYVPDPYMDEVFHVSQAKQYCEGNYYDWNPKLTTPPGLYLISNLILRPLSLLSTRYFCSTNFLRATNVLFGIGLYLILWKLTIKLHPFQDRDLLSFNTLTLSIFPVGWFYNFLYYTDSGSTFFVLWSYLLSIEERYWMSALVGGISVLFRQTNIIWVCFILGTSMLALLSSSNKRSNVRGRKMTYYRGINIRPNIAIQEISGFLTLVSKNFIKLLTILCSYFLILLSFVIFLKWNGGIVLGDKSNHVAVLHIPQIFYFISFTTIFSVPIILKVEHVERLFNGILNLRLNRKRLYLFIIAIIMIFVINNFTYEHPFLLSDNRHYTFYIWKDIYQRHYLIKYLLIPAYMIGGWILLESIALRQSFLWVLIYIIAVCLSLIPSPLLEFRYFIIPYYIFRLHIGQPDGLRLFIEFLIYAAVNAQTEHLFLEEPFVWFSEIHKWQRFMW